MSLYKSLFSLLFLYIGIELHGQKVLTVTEIDMDGGTFTGQKNADINSTITLSFDQRELIKKLNAHGVKAGLPDNIKKLLDLFTDALARKQQWIRALNNTVVIYEKDKTTNLDLFLDEQSRIALEILTVIKADEKALGYFEEIGPAPWKQLTYALQKRINEIDSQIIHSTMYQDIRIRVGGRLMHNGQATPLHFEGLDNNPSGEFYEVERWRIMPTKEELEQLTALQQSIKDDPNTEFNLKQIVTSRYLSPIIDELENTLSTAWDSLRRDVNTTLESLSDHPLKTSILELRIVGEKFINSLPAKINYYKNIQKSPSFTLAGFIQSVNNDAKDFAEIRMSIIDRLKTIKQQLPNATNDVKIVVNKFITKFEKHLQLFKVNILTPSGLAFLTENKKINDAAFEFSDKVLSLSLAQLPSSSTSDLRYSGYRVAGDRVDIMLEVKKGDEVIIPERRSLTLYRIIPHIQPTVGVIFAHPLSQTAITKDVQMAPSYNLLFKGIFGISKHAKRRSPLFNTLLDTNFGVHVSSPDFDKDDIPELGFGVVASTLNDYLQFGWSYNVFLGKNYLFFGLRAPLPFMNQNVNVSSRE